MEQAEIPSTQPVEVTSFISRAANVFMSPGELYAEIAAAPVQSSSWIFPYVISLLIGVLMTVGLFSNPSLREQALAPQREEIQKQVSEGKMTQEQADAAEQMVSPNMIMVLGSASAVVFVSAAMFLVPLVLFAASKVALQFAGTYKKVLEAYAIATLIGALGSVVALLMMYSMDSMLAQPGAAYFIKDSFDRHNFGHNMIVSLNVFTIWQTAAVGLGLAKLSGKPVGAGMAVSFGLWAVWVIASALFGLGFR